MAILILKGSGCRVQEKDFILHKNIIFKRMSECCDVDDYDDDGSYGGEGGDEDHR